MNNAKLNLFHNTTKADKVLIISGFIALLYALISIYLLNTPIENWIFNIGQYNNQLLETFPKAQYWVNISPVFREKLILLYVIYTVTIWTLFSTTIIIMVFEWKWYFNLKGVNFVPKPMSVKFIIFGILFLGVFVFSILLLERGSNIYLLYEEVDRSGVFDRFMSWNTIYGFLLTKALAGVFLIAPITIYFLLYIYITINHFRG